MVHPDPKFEAYLERQRELVDARKRREAVRRMPLPPWFNKVPAQHCRWCGKGVEKPSKYWHKACLSDYFLARNPTNRTDVLEKSWMRCAACSVVLARFVCVKVCEAGDSLHPWEGIKADAPCSRVRLDHEPWQADHIVPLWSLPADLTWRQRLAFFLLPNLQALCTDCHKAKTGAEAGQRAQVRRRA